MWFFRSVEYLARPSLEYLVSNISVLVIWFAFQGMSFSILGLDITPFGLTIGVFLTLNFSRSTPQKVAEISSKQELRQHLWIVAVVWSGLMLSVLFLSDFALQLLVLGSYLTMLALLLIMSVSAPEMIVQLPFRWRADPEERPFVFTALRILILRDAVFCAVAIFVRNHGDLTDWIILIVLGRMFFTICSIGSRWYSGLPKPIEGVRRSEKCSPAPSACLAWQHIAAGIAQYL